MSASKPKGITWLPDVQKHDYVAARAYLSLIYANGKVASLVAKLRRVPVIQHKAKDIFRAARLPLLPVTNTHVAGDSRKIRKGIGLSPLLLARDKANGMLQIADGYHRLCAVYAFDEDAPIHCKIA